MTLEPSGPLEYEMFLVVAAQDEKTLTRIEHQCFDHRKTARRIRLYDAPARRSGARQAPQSPPGQHQKRAPRLAGEIDQIHATQTHANGLSLWQP